MIDCKECLREKVKTLVSGENVCAYCEHWRNECEARALLSLPLKARREELKAREELRGSVWNLKDAMKAIHAAKQELPKNAYRKETKRRGKASVE